MSYTEQAAKQLNEGKAPTDIGVSFKFVRNQTITRKMDL